MNTLVQKAFLGGKDEVKGLADWAMQAESETLSLRRRLRKQEHDFSTLFEIVGQISARSLDLVVMQTYLLRTVAGHFTTPKLLIIRCHKVTDRQMTVSATQGIREAQVTIPLDSPLCTEALNRRFCLVLNEMPEQMQGLPEVMALKALGIQVIVPLIQEVETPETVLEGFLCLGSRLANRMYGGGDLEFLNTLGKMLAICLRNEALYRSSIIDDLTGVASRGHFDARLSQELNRIQIYGHRSMGLVMLDVDRFKSFNDTYGHQTGDRVLTEIARVLVGQVRNVDLVARYGGEEFAIILLEIERERVLDVSQRLRRAVEALELTSMDGQPLKVTASFGAACFPDDAKDRTELIQLADKALYVAKDSGRNRVVMAPPGNYRKLPAKSEVEETREVKSGTSRKFERRRPSDRVPTESDVKA
ncbi:MAG: GGDEF domain-containing protein [Planctomycetota bacterium]|nr:GGDEF domain-containing protein [Planctomycetota bacterium]